MCLPVCLYTYHHLPIETKTAYSGRCQDRLLWYSVSPQRSSFAIWPLVTIICDHLSEVRLPDVTYQSAWPFME